MTLSTQIHEDVKRLARLAANIMDAHTCAIFLPTSLLTPQFAPTGLTDEPASPLVTTQASSLMREVEGNAHPHEGGTINTLRGTSVSPSAVTKKTIELKKVVSDPLPPPQAKSIDLVALQSLSSRAYTDVRLQVGVGLIGWVAEHGRPIHIAPFDLDSSTLGLYPENEGIRCLVAVPIPIQLASPLSGERDAPQLFGVLMCDSKKAFSFSKIQVKHLEELAPAIGRLIYWAHRPQPTQEGDSSWSSFTSRTQRLADAIGANSIEILRIEMTNLETIEEKLGVSVALQRSEQFSRLLQQALPPHFPVTKLASAELLVAVDNMMSTFFQNKIKVLAERLNEQGVPFLINTTVHRSTGSGTLKGKHLDIDAVLRQPVLAVHSNQSVVSGGRRA